MTKEEYDRQLARTAKYAELHRAALDLKNDLNTVTQITTGATESKTWHNVQVRFGYGENPPAIRALTNRGRVMEVGEMLVKLLTDEIFKTAEQMEAV